eukprot:7358367-Pyramimonas_sp.AAC.1
MGTDARSSRGWNGGAAESRALAVAAALVAIGNTAEASAAAGNASGGRGLARRFDFKGRTKP